MLVGNYGVGNLGDELLRSYFVEAFPELSWCIVVVSPREKSEYSRLPAGIRSLLSLRWIKTLCAMRKADAFVFGGGSLFTDIESLRACILWFLHAAAAKCLRKPIILAFQGVGPFRTRVGEALARKSFSWASHISVRDDVSFTRMQSWKLNTKIVQSFDPIFCLYCREKTDDCIKNVITIVPRKNSDAIFLDVVKKECEEHPQAPLHILLLEPEAEQQIITLFQENLPASCEVYPCGTLQELFRRLSSATLVITQRYHAALAALALRIPLRIVPQGEGDKLHALPKDTPREKLLALVKVGEDALRDKLRELR